MRYEKETKQYISESRFINENLGGLPDVDALKGIYEKMPFLEKENMTIEERYLIMFSYSHLPPDLAKISKIFSDFAQKWQCSELDTIAAMGIALSQLHAFVPENIERNECFSKLYESQKRKGIYRLSLIMEAKDCAIRAVIFHNQLI